MIDSAEIVDLYFGFIMKDGGVDRTVIFSLTWGVMGLYYFHASTYPYIPGFVHQNLKKNLEATTTAWRKVITLCHVCISGYAEEKIDSNSPTQTCS